MTTYYVDAVGGNDANTGISPSFAWQTIGKVNSSIFSPGDSVLLKTGCAWRETLSFTSSGTSGLPITIGSYGYDRKPKLIGANIISGFALYDAPSNTYRTSHTSIDASAAVWENGLRLVRVFSIAACESTPGSSYYDASNNLIYLHSAAENPDPTTNGLAYEASTRGNVAVDNGHSWLIWQDLEIRQGFSNLSAHLLTGGNHLVRKCSYYENANHGLSFYGANCVGQDLYSENNAGGAFLFYGTSSNGNILKRLCVVRYNGEGGAAIQTHGGAGAITQNIVEDSIFSSNVEPPNNVGCITISADAGTEIIARRNKIAGNWIYAFSNTGGGANSEFTGNVIDGSGLTKRCVNLTSGATGVRIYNNTYYTNGAQDFISAAVGSSADVKNNIVQVGASSFYVNSPTSTLTASNNCYFGSTRASPFNTDSGAKTFAQWQSLGFDANGLIANPLLANPQTGDFSLQSTSPVVDAGSNLGASFETALLSPTSWPCGVLTANQNDYGAAWEIGAFVS